MLRIRKPLLLLLGMLGGYCFTWAQGVLRDPTMPPPGIKLPVAATDRGNAGDILAEAPRSIIRITPIGGRKQVVVDGRTLQSGDQIKQWRLVTITANGAVFKDSRGTRSVPALTSSISKKPVAGSASQK